MLPTIVETTQAELDYWKSQAEAWHGLLAEADKANGRLQVEIHQAGEREKIATEVYNQQQTSQRELELLYQTAIADALALRAALKRARGRGYVAFEDYALIDSEG